MNIKDSKFSAMVDRLMYIRDWMSKFETEEYTYRERENLVWNLRVELKVLLDDLDFKYLSTLAYAELGQWLDNARDSLNAEV